MKNYTVQKGDTLYGVAKQFGTTVSEIKRLNNLTSNTLSVGQVLKINEDTSNPTTYTVQKGDSLYSISNKFGLSVLNLMSYNNLTSTTLQIGQVLKLTPSGEELGSVGDITVVPIYENYIVKKGDNLYDISKKFNTTVEQIKKDNNLSNNDLSIGQNLKIQVGEEYVGIEECYGEGYSNLGKKYIEHTVKKGDDLYSIAKNYSTTVDEIKSLNNLDSNNLTIGQILKVKEIN